MTTHTDRAALEEALGYYRDMEKGGVYSDITRTILAAARAHLDTLPKTKMVEVWRVEWASLAVNKWVPCLRGFQTRVEAEHYTGLLQDADTYGNTVRCIKVTGPHQQEVPST